MPTFKPLELGFFQQFFLGGGGGLGFSVFILWRFGLPCLFCQFSQCGLSNHKSLKFVDVDFQTARAGIFFLFCFFFTVISAFCVCVGGGGFSVFIS